MRGDTDVPVEETVGQQNFYLAQDRFTQSGLRYHRIRAGCRREHDILLCLHLVLGSANG